MTKKRTNRTNRARQGFSMGELMVVIAIIILLVGIAVIAQSVLTDRAAVEETRRILFAAKQGTGEYETVTNGKISHIREVYSPPIYNIKWNNDDPGNKKAVSAIKAVPSAMETMKKSGFDLSLSSTVEIIDSWGTPLMYAAWVDHNDAYDQTKASPKLEIENILPPRGTQFAPKPFWASAGPDKKWGDATKTTKTDTNSDGIDDAVDNMYSYDLD